MSRLDVTTQELFLRLDNNSRSRSAKADALFRRLRLEREDQIADALMRAPRSLAFGDRSFDDGLFGDGSFDDEDLAEAAGVAGGLAAGESKQKRSARE